MGYLTKETPEVFGDFKIGQLICSVTYEKDLVLLAKEKMMLYSACFID